VVGSSSEIKKQALEMGFTTVGVAPAVPIPEAMAAYRAWLKEGFHADMEYLAEHESLKSDLNALLPGVRSVVAVTLNYYQEPPASDLKIARYALGRDYHKVLRSKLKKLALALPEHQNRVCVDSAPTLDRAYAFLAGLGWFGKNTMLIDSQRGSWFFIGLLLTTAQLEPDKPSLGGCGTCRKCIDACPTGAIVQLENRWQIDARKCISYQTIENRGELTEDLHGWTFGCDICQEVCPFNTQRTSQPLRAQNTSEPDFLNPKQWPSLVQLAQIEHSEWDQLTQGSATRRATFEGIKRNAKANL
jgi:epoxyqueuosine reductase